MDIDLIEDEMYELIDQFSETKINQKDFCLALLENIHSFFDGNE